ncbi:hypothetical protein DL98DRAFT_168515 [Cadophora sp. DSE1049]|nr:hypothetical protein DL98DRAFT_168515 [Cadophora sp. DSE1049]
MFLFMPQTFRHNKFTLEKAEDVLFFRHAPLAQPKKRFRIVCAPFLFHNNDITIRNQKLNDSIQYNSPEYSDSTIGDTCPDGFQSSTHSRKMLEGTGHEEKLEQTTSKIAEANVCPCVAKNPLCRKRPMRSQGSRSFLHSVLFKPTTTKSFCI